MPLYSKNYLLNHMAFVLFGQSNFLFCSLNNKLLNRFYLSSVSNLFVKCGS